MRRFTTCLALFVAGFAAAWILLPRQGVAADAPPRLITSKVVALQDTPENKADWGAMRPYFTGQTDGTERVFAAHATVLPGKAVHAAHRHFEEEYLLITQGRGTWHLDGREFPAREGDLLYVAPWVWHGLRNTGDRPLHFVVIKYHPKGVKPAPRPDDRPDEMREPISAQ